MSKYFFCEMERITFLDFQVCLTALLCRNQSRKTLLSKIYYILNKNKENTKVSKFLLFSFLCHKKTIEFWQLEREREREREDDGEVGGGCGSVYSLHCRIRA